MSSEQYRKLAETMMSTLIELHNDGFVTGHGRSIRARWEIRLLGELSTADLREACIDLARSMVVHVLTGNEINDEARHAQEAIYQLQAA